MNNEQNNLNQTPNAESLTPSPVIPPIEPSVSPALTEPIVPVTPVAPEVPTAPVAPVTPIIEPIAPVVTEQPIPVAPEVPVTPVIPTEPVITPVVEEVAPQVTPVIEPTVESVAPMVEPVAPTHVVVPEAPVASVIDTTVSQAIETPVVTPVAPVASPALEGESFTAVSTPTVPQEPSPVEPVVSPAPTLTVDPLLAAPTAAPASTPAPAPQKKKINAKNLIIILVVLIALGVGGFFAYKYLFVTPHKVYKTFVSEMFAEGKKYIGFDTDLNKSLLYSGDMMLETNIPDIKAYDKYSFNYQIGLDVPNKKLELELGVANNKKALLSAGMYIFDNVGYLNSNELFDKIIKVGEVDFDWNQIIDVDTMKDIERVYDRLSIALQDMIPEDQIKSDKATIKVNGKDLKVTENYFEINQANAKTIVERFINSFISDEEVLSFFAGYMGIDVNTLKIQLQSIPTTMDMGTVSDEKVRISIYTKGKTTLAGYSVKIFDGEETLEIINGAFDNGIGKVVIGTTDANLTIDINNNTYNFSLYTFGDVAFTGVFKKINDNQIELTLNLDGVVLNINSTTTSSGNMTSNTVIFEASYEGESLKITLNNKYEVGAAVGDVDVSNVETIEDVDLEEISEKLEDTLEGTPLMDLVEYLMFSKEEIPDYDDSYYDDYEDDYDDMLNDFEDEFGNMDDYF